MSTQIWIEVLAPAMVRAAFAPLLAQYCQSYTIKEGPAILIVFPHNWQHIPDRTSSQGRLLRVVLLTDGEDTDLFHAACGGIDVLVSVEDDLEELHQGVLAAAEGRSYCSPSLVPALLRSVRSRSEGGAEQRLPKSLQSLTPREREMALEAAEGRTDREIAGLLHVSIATVKTHLAHVYEKLDIRGRNQLPRFVPLLRSLPTRSPGNTL